MILFVGVAVPPSLPPPPLPPHTIQLSSKWIIRELLRRALLYKNKGLIKGYSARTKEQRTFGTPCTCFCKRFGEQEIQLMLFAMNFEGVEQFVHYFKNEIPR